jgi:hypothetical protein
MITPKTLLNQSEHDISQKPPHEVANEIRLLLDEINIRIASQDIVGISDCISAMKLRILHLDRIVIEFRKANGL